MPPAKYDPEVSEKVTSHLLGKSITLCYQCGICTGICPSSKLTALRTRELIHRASLGQKEILKSKDLWLCTVCYTCYEHCHLGVKVPDALIILRNIATELGNIPEHFKNVGKLFINTGFAFPFSKFTDKMRMEFALAQIRTNQNLVKEIQKLARLTGFDKLIEDKK